MGVNAGFVPSSPLNPCSQEFYGRKFALFKSKEGEEKSLGEILAGGEAGERESVLENMREALTKLLDK